MALPDEFLQRLRDNNSIESVMSGYVSLKRAGRYQKCNCPFHSEKTPSCFVYPDTNSFYCFGCGAGGDVITFVMKIENLDYFEAVKLLAQRSGMSLPEDNFDDTIAKQKARIYEINKKAARFFHNQLKTEAGKPGLQYLLERGVSVDMIRKYGLGFAANSWSNLRTHLLGEGFSAEEINAANLISFSKEKKTSFDVFRNRVMFPIIDLRGNVIAFGGRALDTTADPRKYLNSSDTPVFKKSKNLFSLNYAKNVAIKEKKLILCEGYMDVIAVHQAGFENAVATLGTAITPEQARLMSQYCNEVIICYDSDQAGQKASQKAINLLSEVGITTKVIKMEGAKDPDEYIKKFGAGRFKQLLEKSEGAIDFELNKCKKDLDLNTEVDKVTYLKRTFEVLSEIESQLEREVYISKIADNQKVSKSVIQAEVDNLIRIKKRSSEKKEWSRIASGNNQRKDDVNPEALKFPKQAKAEQGIIAFLFNHPDKLSDISSRLSPDDFVTDFNKRVFNILSHKIKSGADYSISSFNAEFSPDQMGKISEILATNRNMELEFETIIDYISVLKNFSQSSDSNKSGADMSDDEFLQFFNNLKNKK